MFFLEGSRVPLLQIVLYVRSSHGNVQRRVCVHQAEQVHHRSAVQKAKYVHPLLIVQCVPADIHMGFLKTLLIDKRKDTAAALIIRKNPVNRTVCLLYTSPSPRDGLLSRM